MAPGPPQKHLPWHLPPTGTCHASVSTCHASASTRHASASTRHGSASTRHGHKPVACAMAFATKHLPWHLPCKRQHLPCKRQHTPQCLPWFAAHATKKHTPARKRLPKRLPKRSREWGGGNLWGTSTPRNREGCVATNPLTLSSIT